MAFIFDPIEELNWVAVQNAAKKEKIRQAATSAYAAAKASAAASAAQFAASTPPPGHPAGVPAPPTPTPQFEASTPPPGHPAGVPAPISQVYTPPPPREYSPSDIATYDSYGAPTPSSSNYGGQLSPAITPPGGIAPVDYQQISEAIRPTMRPTPSIGPDYDSMYDPPADSGGGGGYFGGVMGAIGDGFSAIGDGLSAIDRGIGEINPIGSLFKQWGIDHVPFGGKPSQLFSDLDYIAQVGSHLTGPLMRAGEAQFGPPVVSQYNFLQGLDPTGTLPELPGLIGKPMSSLYGTAASTGIVPEMPSTPEAVDLLRRDIPDYEGAVERFRERPLQEQLAAGLYYDPLSVVPGSAVTAPIRGLGGAIGDIGKLTSPISSVFRNRRIADAAEEVGSTLRSATDLAENARIPLTEAAGEPQISSLPPEGPWAIRQVASTLLSPTRTVPAALGGGIAATLDDDASPEDRVRNFFLGAATGALFPEATSVASKVGGLPQRAIKATTGLDLTIGNVIPRQVLSLPRDSRFRGFSLSMPDFSNVREKLTLSDHAKNTWLRAYGIISPKDKQKILSNHRFGAIVASDNFNQRIAPTRGDEVGEIVHRAFRNSDLKFDDMNRPLDVRGNLLPVFDPKTGLRVKTDDPVTVLDDGYEVLSGGLLSGAQIADVREVIENFPDAYRNLLTDEQIDAIHILDPFVNELRVVNGKLGVKIDWEDGYFPRGHYIGDSDPVFRAGRMDMPSGTTPGSQKARTFRTQAEGVQVKGKAELPWEAARRFIRDEYERVSAIHHAQAILDLTGPDGRRIGDSVNVAAEAGIEGLKEALKPLAQQRRELQRQLASRKTEFNSVMRDIGRNDRKINALVEKIDLASEPVKAADSLLDVAKFAQDTVSESLSLFNAAYKSTVRAGKDSVREGKRLQAAIKLAERARGRLDTAMERVAKFDDRLAKLEPRMPDANELASMPIEHLRDMRADVLRSYDNALSLRNAALRSTYRAQKQLKAEITAGQNAELAQMWLDELVAQTGDLSKQIADDVRDVHRWMNQLIRQTEKTGRQKVRKAEKLGQLKGERKILTEQAKVNWGRAFKLDEKMEEIRDKIRVLDDAMVPHNVRMAELKRDVSIAKEIASDRVKWSTGQIHLAPLQRYPLPTDWVNHYNRVAEQRLAGRSGEAGWFEELNDFTRFIETSFDAAAPMTTGLLGTFDKPGRLVTSTLRGLDDAIRNNSYWEYLFNDVTDFAIQHDLPTPQFLMGHGFEIGRPEIFSGRGTLARATDPSVFRRIMDLPGPRQFQSLFEATSADIRVDILYDSLLQAKQAGRDPYSYRVINDVITSAGQLSGRGQGFTIPGLSPAANNLIFFASKYTRALFDSVGNAVVSGTMVGDNARRALLRFVGIGAASTYLISQATGYEWNPERPFETRIGDWQVDLGSTYSTFFYRAHNALSSASEGDWQGAITEIIKYGQGKFSPMLSRGMKLTDAISRDLGWDTNISMWEVPALSEQLQDPKKMALEFLPVPFTAREMSEAFDDTRFESTQAAINYLLGIPLGFFGIKNRPLTARDKFYDSSNEAYEEYEPSFYDKQEGWGPQDDPLFRHLFQEMHPELVPEAEGRRQEKFEEKRDALQKDLEEIERRFAQGESTLEEFKEKHQDANLYYRGRIEHLVEEFKDNPPKRGSPAWWLETYYELYDKASPFEGSVLTDFDQFNILVGQWQAELDREFGQGTGETALQYIQELGYATTTPLYAEYRRAINTLASAGYFDSNVLPRYENLTTEDQEWVRDQLYAIDRYAPDSLTGEPFEEKLGWFLLESEHSPLKERGIEDPYGEEGSAIFYDILGAYKAEQALSWLKQNDTGMPNEGTLAYQGLNYLNREFWYFVEDHEDELKWLRSSSYIEQILSTED